MDAPQPIAAPAQRDAPTQVLRNAFVLVIAQVAAIPLSIVVNLVMARKLGPSDFGAFYLVSTYATAAFLLIEWGQNGTLPAMIAKQRERAAQWLGSALLWRALSLPLVLALVVAGCALLGYAGDFQQLLAMFFISAAIGSATAACNDAVRGFERTDVAAYAAVGTQLLSALLVIPTLLLGARLPGVVVAFACANALVLAFVWRGVRSTGMGRLSVDRAALKQLAVDGTPFFFFALTMNLQPNIDALYLSKLAPEHVIGWHAASRKLIGVAIFPAGALITALYPTMCRLFASDLDGYRRTAKTSLETSALAVVPLAVGTFLYADLGIQIFGKQDYGAAADNLRMLAPFVLLLYFSMPLGSCLLAAGRQRLWTGVQALCIGVSLIANPILIPWFQARTGNGGLGVCASTVISESLMVLCGVVLMPKAIFDRELLTNLLRLGVAGAVMFAVGRVLAGSSPYWVAPVAALSYFASLRAIGGLKAEQLQLFRDIVARKRAR